MAFGDTFRSERTIYWCVRFGTGILAALFLLIVGSRLIYPFDAGTWESFNWMAAGHLLAGENPYSFAFTEPFSMPPYGIVFYALLAVGLKFFGYQLWFGRLLTIIALALGGQAAAGLTEKITKDRESARLTFLAVLAMFPLQIWTGLMRPDLIAAAFAVSALWLVFRLEREEKTGFWRILLIAVTAAAAFFTKTSFLMASGVVFLRFLQLRKWREAAGYIAAIVLLAGTGILTLNVTSSGGYFWQHFTHAETLPFDFSDAAGLLISMLKQPAFSFSIILAAFYIFQNRQVFQLLTVDKALEILTSGELLIAVSFLISAVWSFISSGRTGASINYYVENSFLLAVVCGIVYAGFRRNLKPAGVFAMIVVLTLGGAFQMLRIFRGEYVRWQSRSYYREVYETAGSLIDPGDQCVSVNPELVVPHGCAFEFDDFTDYTGTWAPGLNEIFEREVRKGKYRIVIWNDAEFQTRFPNYRLIPMRQAPPENYYKVYLYVRQTP